VGFENEQDKKAAGRAMASAIGKTLPGSVIRLHTVRVLAEFGTDGYDHLDAVLGIANDPSWETRAAVATALGRVGAAVYDEKEKDKPPPADGSPRRPKRPASRVAMDKLAHVLIKDSSGVVRMEALQSMVLLGAPYSPDPEAYLVLAKPYAEAVGLRMKLEKDPVVKIWLHLVQVMYDDRTMEVNAKKIAEYLTDKDDELKLAALQALSVLGSKARPALADVIGCLQHPEPVVVAAALTTLVAIGSGAKYALDDLRKLQASTKHDGIKKMTEQAIKAITEVKPDPEPKKKDEKKK
jgi:hypothetical protein